MVTHEALSVSWFPGGLISANSQRTCRVLGHPGDPFRNLLMSLLPHGKQISPDKDVNFPCTTAAFTLSHEPAGFVVLCQLAQGLSLVCGFCPPDQVRGRLGSKYCAEVHPGPLAGLPSDGRSPSRPCLRLVLLVVFISMNTIGSRTRDSHSISSRPCRAYTSGSSPTRA